MSSLYANLFKYRKREGRSPLEDFLTEALRDLLSRMPSRLVYSFIELMLPQDAITAWRSFASESPRLSWKSQTFVPGGRIDLLLEAGDMPVIAIEIKIAAAFHAAGKTAILAENSEADQLAAYGGWLWRSQDKRHESFSALSIITHSTSSPANFLDKSGDRTYQIALRHVCYWSQIWKWLRKINSDASQKEVSDWLSLSRDFALFLEENGMASETISFSDVSAADLYIGSADRFRNTFDSARKIIMSPTGLGVLASGRSKSFRYRADGRVLSDDVYLSSGKKIQGDWYLEWGIRLHGKGWWDDTRPPMPASSYAFVYFGSDKTELPVLFSGAQKGVWRWISEGEERYIIATQELSVLAKGAPGKELGENLVSWLAQAVTEFKSMLLATTAKDDR